MIIRVALSKIARSNVDIFISSYILYVRKQSAQHAESEFGIDLPENKKRLHNPRSTPALHRLYSLLAFLKRVNLGIGLVT